MSVVYSIAAVSCKLLLLLQIDSIGIISISLLVSSMTQTNLSVGSCIQSGLNQSILTF